MVSKKRPCCHVLGDDAQTILLHLLVVLRLDRVDAVLVVDDLDAGAADQLHVDRTGHVVTTNEVRRIDRLFGDDLGTGVGWQRGGDVVERELDAIRTGLVDGELPFVVDKVVTNEAGWAGILS